MFTRLTILDDSEKVLLTSAYLEEQDISPFTPTALVLAAWRLFPETFSMKGYQSQYPDSHKVLSLVYPIHPNSKFAQAKNDKLTLTQWARIEAYSLATMVDLKFPPYSSLEDRYSFLQRTLFSTAMLKHQNQVEDGVSWEEALEFWGVSDVEDVKEKATKTFDSLTKDCQDLLANGNGVIPLPDPANSKVFLIHKPVVMDDLMQIRLLHLILLKKFRGKLHVRA